MTRRKLPCFVVCLLGAWALTPGTASADVWQKLHWDKLHDADHVEYYSHLNYWAPGLYRIRAFHNPPPARFYPPGHHESLPFWKRLKWRKRSAPADAPCPPGEFTGPEVLPAPAESLPPPMPPAPADDAEPQARFPGRERK